MGSGLIYAVIIVMWGAYFIPLWLRRHEERSEARSVDRFSDAMRVLSGRSAETQKRVSSPAVESSMARGVEPPRPERTRSKAARSLALRRRRILAGLVIVSVVVAPVPALTSLPWSLGLLPTAATLCFLVHLRLQARRSRELSRTRSSMRRRTLARLRRFDSADQIFQARRAMGEQRAVATADTEPTAQIAGAWQPVPVPLPTYVTKPVAPRTQQAPPPQTAPEEPFDQIAAAPTVDELMERRAVND